MLTSLNSGCCSVFTSTAVDVVAGPVTSASAVEFIAAAAISLSAGAPKETEAGEETETVTSRAVADIVFVEVVTDVTTCATVADELNAGVEGEA